MQHVKILDTLMDHTYTHDVIMSLHVGGVKKRDHTHPYYYYYYYSCTARLLVKDVCLTHSVMLIIMAVSLNTLSCLPSTESQFAAPWVDHTHF